MADTALVVAKQTIPGTVFRYVGYDSATVLKIVKLSSQNTDTPVKVL